MSATYEVIDRETQKVVQVQSLYDAHGNYKPLDPDWQAMFYLREPGTIDEVNVRPATDADELEDIADELSILADRLRQIADKGGEDGD